MATDNYKFTKSEEIAVNKSKIEFINNPIDTEHLGALIDGQKDYIKKLRVIDKIDEISSYIVKEYYVRFK